MQIEKMKLTWLGHAALRINLDSGVTILVDPWLAENPSCPEGEKTPEKADAIFITHGHFDHLGETVEIARRLGSQVFCIHEVANYLEWVGVENVVGLNIGGEVEGPGGVKATMVPAVHSGGISTEDGIVSGGAAAGWVFALDGAPTIYHAGDTALFGDMSLIGELYSPQIGLLPIGGHFTMNAKQAAQAAKDIGLLTVIPIHYGTFPILAGTPEQLQEASQSHFRVFVPEIGVPFG